MRSILCLVVGAAIAVTTSVAGAQDIGGSTGPAPAAGSTGGSITDTTGVTDHAVVVGRLALRYFGSASMPVLPSSTFMMGDPPPTAPLYTVGARYWLSNNIAFEGGLALGITSGSSTTTATAGAGTTTRAADDPNFFGIGLQVGLPIMLAEAKHLSIHLDPSFAFYYGHSAISVTPEMDVQEDRSLNAVKLSLGANATAELQFGFLGIPQLALQASLGVSLNYANSSQNTVRTTTRMGQQPRTETTVSTSSFGVGTTVGPAYSLSEIITGSISAVYYFGSAPGTQH